MRKIIEEFGIFAVAFLAILVIMKLFKGNIDMISYSNITLIFALSLINIAFRHWLNTAKDKYSMSARNFDFIRRMTMIGIIAVYFYFKQ
ncbi:hypothetical protein [Tepidibacter hydrothermalis]|uniref:Uncharacterized protein n=1 Tax=Tepidibacter hydrothermalis TaxID=3036126 RepID=A0ABY8E8Q7_9FIRM|nr:hypothetical protein [Tepidibacter hydrothermalis]WFD09249.1 hypothetical protein P4S50_12740 [Tepidibacter hydrothermalis]